MKEAEKKTATETVANHCNLQSVDELLSITFARFILRTELCVAANGFPASVLVLGGHAKRYMHRSVLETGMRTNNITLQRKVYHTQTFLNETVATATPEEKMLQNISICSFYSPVLPFLDLGTIHGIVTNWGDLKPEEVEAIHRQRVKQGNALGKVTNSAWSLYWTMTGGVVPDDMTEEMIKSIVGNNAWKAHKSGPKGRVRAAMIAAMEASHKTIVDRNPKPKGRVRAAHKKIVDRNPTLSVEREEAANTQMQQQQREKQQQVEAINAKTQREQAAKTQMQLLEKRRRDDEEIKQMNESLKRLAREAMEAEEFQVAAKKRKRPQDEELKREANQVKNRRFAEAMFVRMKEIEDVEAINAQIQQQQQLLQQRLLRQQQLVMSDPLYHAMLANGIHPTIAYNTILGHHQQQQQLINQQALSDLVDPVVDRLKQQRINLLGNW